MTTKQNTGPDMAAASGIAKDVAGIVVTYNPDPEGLRRGLTEIGRQVGYVVVVDNNSGNIAEWHLEQVGDALGIEINVITLAANLGPGAGFNVGIRDAQVQGYAFVALFDQDSVPKPGMISELAKAHKEITERGARVAAVGPRFLDSESGHLSSFAVGNNDATRQSGAVAARITATDFLISSGSYISMAALSDVGEMDETLFIDYIDAEWCLRAAAKGWTVYGVDAALMEHSLGITRKRFWFLRRRMVSLHASFRYYYIFRNSWLLRRRPYVPSSWKRANRIHNAMLAVYLVVMAPGRLANLTMILRGMVDGSKGVAGPMRAQQHI